MKVIVNRTRYDGSKFLVIDIGLYTPGGTDGFNGKLEEPFKQGLFNYGDVLVVLGSHASGPQMINEVVPGIAMPTPKGGVEVYDAQLTVAF